MNRHERRAKGAINAKLEKAKPKEKYVDKAFEEIQSMLRSMNNKQRHQFNKTLVLQ